MTTPLYLTFRKRVDDACEMLILQQVDPWGHFNSGHPVEVTKFNGQKISCCGGEFGGSLRDLFWRRYIEPFLEDISIKEIDAAIKMASEKGVDVRKLLWELEGMLVGMAAKTLRRMADIDRRLLGRGFPEKIPLRDITSELTEMRVFVTGRIAAEAQMLKTKGRMERLVDWFKESPLVKIAWALLIVLGFCLAIMLKVSDLPEGWSWKDMVKVFLSTIGVEHG